MLFLSLIQTFEYYELSVGSHTESFRSIYGIKTSCIPEILFYIKLRIVRDSRKF